MSGRHPDARERRTIAVGLAVLGLAVVLSFVVMPWARHWRDREAEVSAVRDRVARLKRLTSQRAAIAAAADSVDRARVRARRVLRGRTPALAASDLQGVLQDYARVSRVSVNRLEVSPAADSVGAGERGITASLSAVTDIYGVADLLSRLQSGSVLVSVDEVSVTTNPVLRGNLLQLALTVRAPFLVEP